MVLEYLRKHFPGQPFTAHATGTDTLVIDVSDSGGRRKELRIPQGFLQTYSKSTLDEYLEHARIAEQLETVPSSVSIKQLV